MASDAHVHPNALLKYEKNQEEKRRKLGVLALASATRQVDLDCHLALKEKAKSEGAPELFLSFGLHPQLLLDAPELIDSGWRSLETALEAGSLDALGEVGLDAYGPYAETLGAQVPLFIEQLDRAISYHLPLVLHLRKAHGELFRLSALLKKLPALIVHSCPLSLGEAEGLLRRGINAFFSFGTPLLKGKRSAQKAIASLPLKRILIESDAPYQGLGPNSYSSWEHLKDIRALAYEIRKEAGEDISSDYFEYAIDNNFRSALGNE